MDREGASARFDPISILERHAAVDPFAMDIGPVGGAQILEIESILDTFEHEMPARQGLILYAAAGTVAADLEGDAGNDLGLSLRPATHEYVKFDLKRDIQARTGQVAHRRWAGEQRTLRHELVYAIEPLRPFLCIAGRPIDLPDAGVIEAKEDRVTIRQLHQQKFAKVAAELVGLKRRPTQQAPGRAPSFVAPRALERSVLGKLDQVGRGPIE